MRRKLRVEEDAFEILEGEEGDAESLREQDGPVFLGVEAEQNERPSDAGEDADALREIDDVRIGDNLGKNARVGQ